MIKHSKFLLKKYRIKTKLNIHLWIFFKIRTVAYTNSKSSRRKRIGFGENKLISKMKNVTLHREIFGGGTCVRIPKVRTHL